ncbi:MAG: serine/threonine-protein kinase [Pirellulaceae bacterium]
MSNSMEPDFAQLGLLIDEFTARVRAGERPQIDDYAARYPQFARDIRELFPTLLTMEHVGVDGSEVRVTASGKTPQQLGEYRILREIGRGGMGVVYEAEQESLGRHVAIKVLPYHALMDPKHLTRFHREARAVAQLHHSNIVPVFGVGEHEGIHYYAMQFIRGLGLDLVLDEMRRLRDSTEGAQPSEVASAIYSRHGIGSDAQQAEPFSPNNAPSEQVLVDHVELTEDANEKVAASFDQATNLGDSSGASGNSSSGSMSGYQLYKNVARIGSQVADALVCAHAQGILHRDIKPSNLLIDSSGNAWVTDFGLAKTLEEDLTHTGDLVGTLRYMAPERFRGWSDPRSDVYSLGLTLYEMLTLRPAFREADRAEIIRRVMYANPPRPRQIDPHIPRDLETIVLKATEKEPLSRYQTASELAEDLNRFAADKPIVARRTSMQQLLWLWCRRNPMAAVLSGVIGLLLILLAASSLAYAMHAQRSLASVLSAENSAVEANRRAEVSLFHAYVAQARSVRRTRQPGQRIESLLAISKATELLQRLQLDGDWRATLRNEAIASMSLIDLQVDRRWPGDQYGPRSSHLRWAIDSTVERYARELEGGDVAVYRMVDNELLMRFSGEPHAGKVRPYFEFSSDGRYLGQYAVAKDGQTIVRLFDLVDQRPMFDKPLASIGEAYWRQIAFSPDSQHFLYQAPDMSLQIVSLPSLETRSVPIDNCLSYMSFSPDGKYLAVDVAYTTVWVANTETMELACRFEHPAEVTAVAWSMDGSLLAAACGDKVTYVWQIFDSSQPIAKCIGHTGAVRNVAFGPDSMLVTTSWDQTTRLWNALSGEELMRTESFGGRRFSADGQWLGFEYAGQSIGRFRLIGGSECRLLGGLNVGSSSVVQGLSFSKDSSLLASTAGKELAIWDTSIGDCLERNTTYDSTSTVSFHPESSELFVCGGKGLDRWKVNRDEATSAFLGLTDRTTLLTSNGGTTPAASRIRLNRVFVSEVYDGAARIVNLNTPNRTVEIHDNDWMNSPALSPNGKWASAGSWKTPHWSVWDTTTGEEIVRRPTRLDGAAVTFSPDSQWLLVREADEVNFVSTSDWESKSTLRRDQPGYANVAISLDMKLLAITDMSYVKLYNFSTKELLAILRGPNDVQLSTLHPNAAAICFSPNARFLAVGTYQDLIQLWDLDLVQTNLQQLGLDWEEL